MRGRYELLDCRRPLQHTSPQPREGPLLPTHRDVERLWRGQCERRGRLDLDWGEVLRQDPQHVRPPRMKKAVERLRQRRSWHPWLDGSRELWLERLR
ncbi:hypothetical protein [Mumia zhuanghuii]|uniref:Uncharacterized protein n=1 Tax=Mumia zhuanghuii TaxID=2585211 RepID=A0A5C4M1T3_9ACTN|nr:hypothetical protein [Mumia zhuanghuii]TNC26848.1 hypothetical protein FHE65_34475 [Mumia zhuanghuii]